jgi:hypothetical protein
LMLIWEVQICRSSWISSHGCEVFRVIVEVLHIWKCLVPGLKISSQATENLVLDDCKSASLGRNKVSFLIEPSVSTKAKYLPSPSFLCSCRGLKMSFWIFAPSCVAKLLVQLGYNFHKFNLKRKRQKSKIFKILGKIREVILEVLKR